MGAHPAIPSFGAMLLGLLALGCGSTPPDAQYPATEAQRSGVAMAQRLAMRALGCPLVAVEPILECPGAVSEGECSRDERSPRVLGEALVARGCGRELRFYCGLCGGDLSRCVSELEIGECSADYSAEARGGQR